MALLEVRDLKTYFKTDDGIVKAVDGVSFSVEKGKTLGIVGESGSGKSVTCLTIMGLNAKRNTMSSGEALFKGKNLLTMSSSELRDTRGNDIAMIFQDPMITHDLGVIAEIADDVVVMYAARIAEQAPVEDLFRRPHHPYTWGLLGSLPRLDTDVERLVQIQGQPPSLLNPPRGCRFHPRCPYVMGICKTVEPQLLPAGDETDHFQACHLDVDTKDREAAKLLAGQMAEAS